MRLQVEDHIMRLVEVPSQQWIGHILTGELGIVVFLMILLLVDLPHVMLDAVFGINKLELKYV